MFVIKLADLNVKINNQYDYVFKLCRDYIVDTKDYDFEVSVSSTKLEQESSQNEHKYSLAYCESVCLYREICEKMIDHGRFLFHSCVVEVDGVSYAFSAKSGVGKSTHSRLWLEYFKDRARIINGDKPLLTFSQDNIIAYGTPWCGKEGYNLNTQTNLQAICFLERSQTNEIRTLSRDEIIDRIFHQLIIPKDPLLATKLLEMVDKLINKLPMYLLKCNISLEAVEIAYNKMNEGEHYEN